MKSFFKQNIIVFGRQNITNFGDPIIADCCQYVLKKAAAENKIRANVTIADIYEKDTEVTKKKLKNADKIVFPGGGMNSVVFNNLILETLKLLNPKKNTSIYFNAIGILKVNPKARNEKLLREIFNRPDVKQITTRGDYPQLLKYVNRMPEYPCELVLDPAIWTNETYQISRDETSDVIGIGVIRPEIFMKNGNDFSEDDVLNMYCNIIQELNKRGYKWQLFCNGMKDDYRFGVKILKHMNLDKNIYLGANVENSRQLVEKIASYKAVIAARLHANIISTSLDIPSVALVWNDKMNLFADIIGCPERYLSVKHLLDGEYIIDTLETAIREGYNSDKIAIEKKKTMTTFYNILQNKKNNIW